MLLVPRQAPSKVLGGSPRLSAPSRIRTCGLLLRREARYRRGNLVPTRKSLQIGSFSKRHEKSRRSTSYQLLFPLVPTSEASGATAPYSARAGTSPPPHPSGRRYTSATACSHTDLDQEAGDRALLVVHGCGRDMGSVTAAMAFCCSSAASVRCGPTNACTSRAKQHRAREGRRIARRPGPPLHRFPLPSRAGMKATASSDEDAVADL
jgi:hypothetical protein